MANEHLILCGHATLTSRERVWREAPRVHLRLGKGKSDVHLSIDHLSRQLCAGLPDVATDLLELASYVYVADQAVSRGGAHEIEYGERWRRHFRFEVPVRRPDVWKRSEITAALTETLNFLADETFEFAFTRHKKPPLLDGYLYNRATPGAVEGVQEVMLFSGGLDSLGGAVQEVLQGQRKVVLVSHRPVSKIYARQKQLAAAIAGRVTETRRKPVHVAVAVNKGKRLTHDFTQRSRSFLFAAAAAVVARVCGLNRIRFYENGVISFNLPVSPQALGGRASRTTHPQVLNGFQRLLTALFEGDFVVENPFLWKTKAQVLAEIRAAGHADLCARTSSCPHTIEATTDQPHCGRCSQCVDRRLNALAAGLDAQQDPSDIYASDVLTGARDGADLTMSEGYLGTALRILQMKAPAEFLAEFAEAARVLRHVDVTPDRAAERLFGLHQCHARQITHALDAAVKAESLELLLRKHPTNCLLRLALAAPVRPESEGENGRLVGPVSPRCPGLTLDPGKFEVRSGVKKCFLGNSLEYRLLSRLLRSPGIYISNDTLKEDVWEDAQTGKNAIQRVVCNLRRKLKEADIDAVVIDGSQNGHYRLMLPS